MPLAGACRPEDVRHTLKPFSFAGEASLLLRGGKERVDGGLAFSTGRPEHAAQTLNALALAGGGAGDNGNRCLRNVHTFIKRAARDQYIEDTLAE